MIIPIKLILSEEQAKRVERTNLKNCLEVTLRVLNKYKALDSETALAVLELEKYKDVLIDLWKTVHHKIFEIKLTPVGDKDV